METELSEDQIASYHKDGFIAIEGFLDAEELETWRRVTNQAVAERLASSRERTNQKTDANYYSKVFVQCLRLADTNAEMQERIYDPRIGKMAAALAGVDGIRVWHDQALINGATFNGTRNILPEAYFKMLEEGDLLDDEEQNPLIWKADRDEPIPAEV